MYDNDDLDRIRVVTFGGEVIGFCVFGDPDGSPEGFGPFGVRTDFRGKKLGQILLADCLLEMKKRGLHNAWMQWTGKESAAHFVYEKAGFSITRSHVILDKLL
jgi:GNAT superfamily N-acetyltransferase